MKFLNATFQKPTFPNFGIVYQTQQAPGGEGSTSDDEAGEDEKPTDDRD
ncbi:hypothetical protein [Microscilla marina]|uniref:Uncharacterized protein n=1 Tax=Microscilla marina ATCC 23134 TaxID=313606 RepID=A1ZFU0_MICM2|nr:hypothetical protein [Microscilla marina]EAY30864.1 hypothetical protein M23134_01188 [Microscilla marina ATCC 23134]